MRNSLKKTTALLLVVLMSLSVLALNPQTEVKASGETFIIDPGHGGSDPGACNGTRHEADDVLALSLKVGAIVEKYATVTYTRTTDTYLSLSQRCSIANGNGNKYFISVHRNSYSSATANGLETYYASKYTSSSTQAKFATAIQNAVMAAVPSFRNRGVKTANYTVIWSTTMPSCLIETGFISNANDNALFDTYNDEIAVAIAKGMLEMIGVNLDSGVSITHKLDGNSYVDMGSDFYAKVRHSASGKYLTDVGNDVQAADATGTNTQVWHFMKQANGSYLIGNVSTSKFWDVKDSSYTDGTDLITNSITYEDNQKFFIYYNNTKFHFMPVGGDKTVDVSASTYNAQIYGSTVGTDTSTTVYKARSFDLEVVSIYSGPATISNLGDSFVANIKNVSSGKYVTAKSGSLVAAGQSNGDDQRWQFTRLANGAYTIVSVSEGISVDIYNTMIEEGTSVGMYTLHGGPAQNFFIIEDNGSYYVKSTYTLNTLHLDSDTSKFFLYTTGSDSAKIAAQKFDIIIEGESSKDLLTLKSDSVYTREEDFLCKVNTEETVANILLNFENTMAVVYDADGNVLAPTETVGTGCTVSLLLSGAKVDTVTIIVLGDVTGDGIVDSTDYLRIKSNFLGKISLESYNFKAADVDSNGVVDSTDYVRIKSHFIGAIDLFA